MYVSITEIPDYPKKFPMEVITKYKGHFFSSDLQDTELLEIMD